MKLFIIQIYKNGKNSDSHSSTKIFLNKENAVNWLNEKSYTHDEDDYYEQEGGYRYAILTESTTQD